MILSANVALIPTVALTSFHFNHHSLRLVHDSESTKLGYSLKMLLMITLSILSRSLNYLIGGPSLSGT